MFLLAIAYLSPKVHGETPTRFPLPVIEWHPEPSDNAFVTATHVPPTPKPAPKRLTITQVTSNVTIQGNIALGERLALESNIKWSCLYQLGMRESGWNHLAKNKSSGAYGIPQSLPADKLDTYGNRHDPEVQIRWFIDYIENRYGTSCNALKHSLDHNWY